MKLRMNPIQYVFLMIKSDLDVPPMDVYIYI